MSGASRPPRRRCHLNIAFRTVHSAKGLEADYVMLINVTDGTKGFPSRIEDDPLLHLAMPAPNPHPFAEERRRFILGRDAEMASNPVIPF